MATYKVGHINGKGQGLIATENIPRGALILTDKPILTLHARTGRTERQVDQEIDAAFQRLSKRDQDIFLSLYDYTGRPSLFHESRAVRIFHSNAFSDPNDTKMVMPLISRINHCCIPNAHVIVRPNVAYQKVHAQADISPGEEIQICYRRELDEVLTASQRNYWFKHRFGFECKCKVCLPTVLQWPSDCRRLLISAVRFALEGQQPTDFRNLVQSLGKASRVNDILRKANWPPKIPSVKPVRTPTQKIEYTFLLAKLREAEGIDSLMTATTFNEAANLLFTLQHRYAATFIVHTFRNHQVFFVEAVRCIEAWMKKAVYHSTCAQGTSSEPSEPEVNLQTILSDSVCVATKSDAPRDNSNGDQEKKCYVVALNTLAKESPKCLTLGQCEEFFSKR